jgi:hypothetical protein
MASKTDDNPSGKEAPTSKDSAAATKGSVSITRTLTATLAGNQERYAKLRAKKALPKGDLDETVDDDEIEESHDAGELWESFFHAAATGNLPMVTKIVGAGIAVDYTIPEGTRNPYRARWNMNKEDGTRTWLSPTPLEIALIYNKENVASYLIDQHANQQLPMVSAPRLKAAGKRWVYHTPLTYIMMGPFSNNLFEKSIDAQRNLKDSVLKGWDPVMQIARNACHSRHNNRLTHIINHQELSKYVPEITVDHIQTAAKGFYKVYPQRNVPRELVLNTIIMESGGYAGGSAAFEELLKHWTTKSKWVTQPDKTKIWVEGGWHPDGAKRLRKLKAKYGPKTAIEIPDRTKPRQYIDSMPLNMMLTGDKRELWREIQRSWEQGTDAEDDKLWKVYNPEIAERLGITAMPRKTEGKKASTTKDPKGNKKNPKGSKKKLQDPKDLKDPQDPKDPKDPKDTKDPKDPKVPKGNKNTPKDPKGSKAEKGTVSQTDDDATVEAMMAKIRENYKEFEAGAKSKKDAGPGYDPDDITGLDDSD